MAVKSGVKHLQYSEHSKAVGLLEDARKRAEELRKERKAESAASGLRESPIVPPPHVAGPIAAGASNGRSLAEIEMWQEYDTHGANFDAGEDQADPHAQHERLRREADIFGLMNAEAVARKMGFGDIDIEAEETLREEEEEDFLGEIMRNAGECESQVGWSRLGS